MAGTIAELKAKLGFDVNYKGLRDFEQSLKKVQNRINSSGGLTGDFKKSTSAQSDFYKSVTQGYAKVKPTLEDHRRNLMRIREGFKQNRLSAEEYRNARLRTLAAISQAEKRIHRERMARIRREQKAQGPFAGGQDPRQAGNHRLISALHSDVGLGVMAGGFAAFQSSRSYQEFVGMEQGLSAAMGSMEQGQKEVEWLIKLSNRLGISLREAADGYKGLAAATQGSNLEGKETRRIFEAVASYARVLNLSLDDQKGVFRALTQMQSKGVVNAEELSQQFGERLPGGFKAAARAMNMTTAELRKATEQGEVTAEELFPNLSTELMRMANRGDQLTKAINNTGAALNRLGNNVWIANKQFNEAGFDRGFRDLLNTMSTFIMESEELWRLLGSTAGFLAEALRAPFEVLTDLGQALGFVTEKGQELNLNYNQMVGIFALLFKWSRRLLAVFVLLPYTLSALSRAWNEGGIGNWSVALGAAAATALLFRKRLLSIGKAARSASQSVNQALGRSAGQTVSETAQRSARSVASDPWRRSTIWERAGNALRESVKGGSGRLPVIGFGADSIMDENEFMQRQQQMPWWNLTGRMEAAQNEQNRQMILNGDIRFEITGDNASEISDEVIRVINENFIRPASMNDPNTEK